MDSKAVITVSYVNIVAEVKVVYATGSSSSTGATTTSPSYVIPIVSASYVNILLDYMIDIIGRNPVLLDTVLKSDVTLRAFVKSLSDQPVPSDIAIRLFSKLLTDSKTTVDVKTFSLEKALTDT